MGFFVLIVYLKRLKLKFSVSASQRSAAFAAGWADFRPPVFCQTTLAFLSSDQTSPAANANPSLDSFLKQLHQHCRESNIFNLLTYR